jgi:hypothetical protein
MRRPVDARGRSCDIPPWEHQQGGRGGEDVREQAGQH